MLETSNDLDTRGRILKSAVNLFLNQGYEKTTIRKITSNAEVTTGSLYHFFSNKEEIVITIIGEVFESLISKADQLASENNNPVLGFSIEVSLHFKILDKYPTIVDIWHMVYTSKTGSALILKKATNAAIKWFSQYNQGYNCTDYYLQVVAMRGISLSFMSEAKYGSKIDLQERLSFIIKTGMKIFNVPVDDVVGLINQTSEIVADIDVSLENFVTF